MRKFIAIAVLGLLISSCADRGFNKSRYGKLNWINHGFEKKSDNIQDEDISEVEKNDNIKIELIESVELSTEVKSSPNTGLTSKLKKTTPVKSAEVGSIENEELAGTSPIDTEIHTGESQINDGVAYAPKKKNGLNNTKDVSEDGIMLLILVILALIIPPIAVLVYEGVTTRFWLNLLFAILGGALFFVSPGLGIFALIAVVHALLIVLGII